MFGYIRVSSKEQNIERQIKEIQELGINERDIFIDKRGGINEEMVAKGTGLTIEKVIDLKNKWLTKDGAISSHFYINGKSEII